MKRTILLLAILSSVAALSAQNPGRTWKLPQRGPERVQPLAWGIPAAAHLMRRAGFSASLEELDRMVQQGYPATLDELIDFEGVDDSAMERALADKQYQLAYYEPELEISFASLLDLNREWLFRMIHTRHQLVEKMTLFWHDHFATSIEAVPLVDCISIRTNCPDGLPLLQIQNQTFREHALGNFKEMVRAIARDPAMIIFLDGFSNTAGAPNENWARELLELFTMGEGNGYTEEDVQEAARAFTGWTLSPLNYRFAYNLFTHDHRYPKRFLGEEIYPSGNDPVPGSRDGEAVIDIIFRQPQVAEFVTRKLWEFFVYPDPSDQVIEPLAQLFRESGYELKPLMRAIFEHPHFLSNKAYRAKIKSPVELAVNSFRELSVQDPDNLPLVMFFFSLGQLLYLPPDVGGWTADRGWINTGTALGRYNFLNFLTSNRPGLYPLPALVNDQIPVEEWIARYQPGNGSEVVGLFLEALVQGDASTDTRYTLETYLETGSNGSPKVFDITDPGAVDEKVRGLIYLILLLPAYQLN